MLSWPLALAIRAVEEQGCGLPPTLDRPEDLIRRLAFVTMQVGVFSGVQHELNFSIDFKTKALQDICGCHPVRQTTAEATLRLKRHLGRFRCIAPDKLVICHHAGKAMMAKTRQDLIRRLDPYWKMEAGNVLLVPFPLVAVSQARLSVVSLLPVAATMLLLVIGALYWRGKVRQLRGDSGNFPRLLRGIRAVHAPALGLTLAGCGTALAGLLWPDWTAGPVDRYGAAAYALLATLEYVNYYQRQLQHFDNLADFKRLLNAQGFRRSWMARDLAELGLAEREPKP